MWLANQHHDNTGGFFLEAKAIWELTGIDGGLFLL